MLVVWKKTKENPCYAGSVHTKRSKLSRKVPLSWDTLPKSINGSRCVNQVWPRPLRSTCNFLSFDVWWGDGDPPFFTGEPKPPFRKNQNFRRELGTVRECEFHLWWNCEDSHEAELKLWSSPPKCAIGSINSHYFHIIGDGNINPIVGVYIPIIRIPIKGGMSLSPIKRDNLDHGTNDF